VQRFVEIYLALAGNAAEAVRLGVLERYLRAAEAADAAWAAYLLAGPRQRAWVSSTHLRTAATSVARIEPWLFTASHAATRDVAETIALLLGPSNEPVSGSLTHWMEERLPPLGALRGAALRDALAATWVLLGRDARWVVNRILLGTARVPHGEALVQRALAAMTSAPEAEIARRLAPPWRPSPAFWHAVQAPSAMRAAEAPIAVETSAESGHRVHAVLVYVQPGSGTHASLHAQCTFGVWDGDELVAFTKAHALLPHDEARALDAWARAHTLERFGPVRRVEPALVFDLAFDAIALSRRHKSGVVVRAPRIVHWLRDADPAHAGTLASLTVLAGQNERSSSDDETD
jgi:hypothetical protein